MGEIQTENNTLLRGGIETMRDPNVSKSGKIGTFGIVLLAALAFVGVKTIEAMKEGE